ncbi:MAG: 2-phospho-L-lactate guanylyltransferase [Actinomycetota bacterium]|nr:2-phospho-L-lactate guanylyltransferase [Actinomycetota bacterium]
MDAGILPVKGLGRAKQRLLERFGDEGRAEIARALVTDALELCRQSSGLLSWWVISDDREVLDLAASYGCRGIQDQADSLNGALGQAVQTVMFEGASSITIIPADAPMAYVGDLRDLLDTGSTSDIVIVPSERDGGTNALYLRPPDLMEPRFGTASMQAHVSLAERLGHRCSILILPRLALDIDTPEDVDAFLRKDKLGTSNTATVLQRLVAENRESP